MANITRTPPPDGEPLELAPFQPTPEQKKEVTDAVRASRADATWRAYRADWQDWEAWAKANATTVIPASVASVCAFLAERGKTHSIATLEGRLSGIAQAHRMRNLPSPTHDPQVRMVMAGLRRKKGVIPNRKAAADLDVVRKLLTAFDRKTVGGVRDAALVLLGFAGAFRRSEICALEVRDLDFRPEGVLVLIRRSKTDQEGKGRLVPIQKAPDPEICAVEALRRWIAAGKLTDGPVFRGLTKWGTLRKTALSPQIVAMTVQGAAQKVGLDPTTFGAHSLRAGHVTQALSVGASDRSVQEMTGHRNSAMLDIYKRDVNPFARGTGSDIYKEKK